MYDVAEINDIANLDRYRAVWRELLAETPGASFFQTLEWLEVYWRHSGRQQTLRVLIVGDREKPIGILPLVIRRERRKVGSVRILTYPLDDWGSYYGPIGPLPIDTLLAGLTHVRQTTQGWDLLELRWAPPESDDASETGEVMCLAGFPPRRSVRAETAVIDLSGSWADYLGTHSSKWRNNFRRWEKRLQAAGDVQHIRHRPAGRSHGDEDPRWDLYEHCERLAAISWQGSSTTGTTLSHATTREFLRDVHEVAARNGCVDMNLLSLSGQVIAFAYNYYFNKRIEGLRVGYDPEMSTLSPGNLLYAQAIEDSFRRGDRLYDLGPGSLDCKRQWCSRIEPILQYTYYDPRSFRAQLMKWKGRLEDSRTSRHQSASSKSSSSKSCPAGQS